MIDYYQILQLSENCSFSELKRAYYAVAKQCHPDRFGNSQDKKREFQVLVEAFDVLSDPQKRQTYDGSRHTLFEQMAASSNSAMGNRYSRIMDEEADDILEELIVGNNAPPASSLMTLLSDLEKTDVFVAYREGVDHLRCHRYRPARRALEYTVRCAPGNIVFRVWLARACVKARAYRAAINHLNCAIELGVRRDPPQMLLKVKQELGDLRHRNLPWFIRWFAPVDKHEGLFIVSAEEEMRSELSRAMTKAARKHIKESKNFSESIDKLKIEK